MSDGTGPELPHDFPEGAADMSNEGAVNANTDLRKRRSTRIVQAVPLVVTGVDALGRPFAERTSTLIINCHGCRYQSKHYVLKNMWVNLEVPHPEPGHAPRRVRGKVAWIQRPRTVRQLFQVALELETAGNAWGIAFPPDDWFGFPEEENPMMIAPATGAESLPLPPGIADAPLPLIEAEAGVASPDNLRVFPAPASATDASLQLARQVARLLAEAKQQIHAAAREAAVQAVAAERRLAFEQWEQKYTGFREEVSRETAHAVSLIQEESETRARNAQAAAAESLKNELPRWLAPQLEQLTHELTATLAREGSAQRDQHEKQLSHAQETLQTLSVQAEEAAAKLRAQAEQVEGEVVSRIQEAAKRADEEARRLEAAASAQKETLTGAANETQARIAAAQAEAQRALDEHLHRALETAMHAKAQAEQAEAQLTARMDELARKAQEFQEELARQRESVMGVHRESLGAANNELQERIAGALAEAQKSLNEHLQHTLDAAGQAKERAEQVEAQLVARLEEFSRKAEEHHEELARQREAALNAQRDVMGTAANEIQERIASLRAETEKALHEQLQREIENATQLRNRAEYIEAQIVARLEDAARKAEQRAEEDSRAREAAASTQADFLTATTNEIQGRVAAAQAEAQKELHEQLAREIEAAQARWNASIEGAVQNALQSVEERSGVKLREQTNELRTELREEGAKQSAAVREALQNHTKQLEETLARANEANDRLENFAGRIDNVQQQAIGGFQSQLDDVLTLHRNELHRRSETLFEEIHNRIRGTFESTNSEALQKFDQQLQAMVSPHITQTEEAIHRLAGGRSLLDAAMTMQQDRIRNSADEAFAEAMGRFRENLGSVEQVLSDSAQTISNRHLDELEGKASDLKHRALEEMFKSAEWYEKKGQTQLQHLAEKTVEQASNQLREKAGEVSSLFTTELSHASNSYVAQTQQQMEETVRDSFERVRMLFAEAADTTSAAFTDEIQRNARLELAGFNELMNKTFEDSRARLDSTREQARQMITAEQEDFLRRFQKTMNEVVEKSLGDAREKAQASFGTLLDSLKSMTEAKQVELRSGFTSISNEAAEQYRSRLENISNSWMVATVTTLDHQSRDVIAKIAATAEERLREASAEVFAKFGDTLKERLQQIATGFENISHTPKS